MVGRMASLLDDVIWNALTTEQQHFALRHGDAARFPAEVTSLAGLRAPTPEAFANLATLLPDGATTGVFLPLGLAVTPSLDVLDGAELLQMVQGAKPAGVPEPGLLELGPADAPEMLALAERTRPGPFGTRTRELGTFLGVRAEGRLIAMAGQRLRFPGHVEVSAICTDPEHLGRGLAARLTIEQCRRIHAAGAVPFLHVRAKNERAIALYERLGFVERSRVQYHVVRAAG
jgi:ribosomal protein S18 acetylase RimI-like enzyme